MAFQTLSKLMPDMPERCSIGTDNKRSRIISEKVGNLELGLCSQSFARTINFRDNKAASPGSSSISSLDRRRTERGVAAIIIVYVQIQKKPDTFGGLSERN
ncbi:hypothetical protein TSAR_008185 [Trichomalopsis sarcophagae]|uniref:Uncharacterized protein n=1 Tax=Trichomalopsis sarcophagae TaxID=543379 RepID=A0A232EGK3_9HYME|nr:hypothetical protein TSAR_008185 [Trichomalopsis sarcophagae]